MKALLNITLFFTVFNISAQDTIYFRNSTVVPAKISEVGIMEIKYKRFDNPEGPSYINTKSEIAKIRYANGMTDTITYAPSKATLMTRDGIAQGNGLRLIGTELHYDGRAIGHMQAQFLLKKKSLSANQVAVIKEAISIKRKQQGYNALGTGLFVTGFAVPTVVTLGVLFDDKVYANKNAANEIVAGAIAGALIRIAGQVVLKINKNKTKARKQALTRKYSQYEII